MEVSRGEAREMTRPILCTAVSMVIASTCAMADEGGVSFWLPGQFGSLAAVPTEPGWSLGSVYCHTNADAGAGKSFPRGGRLTVGMDATADLVFLAPSYVFKDPVMGGQAALSVIGAFGRVSVDIEATLTGPLGGVLSGGQGDSLTAVGDLYPLGR